MMLGNYKLVNLMIMILKFELVLPFSLIESNSSFFVNGIQHIRNFKGPSDVVSTKILLHII